MHLKLLSAVTSVALVASCSSSFLPPYAAVQSLLPTRGHQGQESFASSTFPALATLLSRWKEGSRKPLVDASLLSTKEGQLSVIQEVEALLPLLDQLSPLQGHVDMLLKEGDVGEVDSYETASKALLARLDQWKTLLGKADQRAGMKGIFDDIMDAVEQLMALLDVLLQVVEDAYSFYLPVPTNVTSNECATDVDALDYVLTSDLFSLLRLVDSWGKIPDGLLFGNVRAMGMFEECVQLSISYNASLAFGNYTGEEEGEQSERTYKGRYCSIGFKITESNETAFTTAPPSSPEPTAPGPGDARMGIILGAVDIELPFPYLYGTCIPSSCSQDDMLDSLLSFFERRNLRNGTKTELGLVSLHCYAEEDPKEPYTSEDRAMLSLMIIFGVLAGLATLYHFVVSLMDKEPIPVIRGFSLYNNVPALFTHEDCKAAGDTITCLPMLRMVSMLWVIICHQYETNSEFMFNTVDAPSYQDPLISQVVTNGWLAVDTFFVVGGVVLAYRLVPFLSRGGPLWRHALTLVKLFLRKIVRLAPVILCVALFSASLVRFTAAGPRSHVLDEYQDACHKHWWKDPLFINNYKFPGNVGTDVNDCLHNTWYTAVDMQLMLLLPIIFLPFAANKLAGLIVLAVLTVGSIIVPLALTIAYDLPPTPLRVLSGEVHLQYMTIIFLAPWCRAGPWLVGLWLGVLLRSPGFEKVKINKAVVFVGFVVAIVIGLSLVLGLYDYNHMNLDSLLAGNGLADKRWEDNPAMSAAYGSLARPVWGMCVAWVVFACHTGNAGIVNRLLSYPGWRPMGRLSFTMYIVAPVVQLWWSATLMQPTHYSYVDKLFESAGAIAITLMLSILLSCTVEMPLMNSMNLVLPSPAKKQEKVIMDDFRKNKSKTVPMRLL